MSKSSIPLVLRRQVASDSCYRCGYCLTLEVIGIPMEFDHIIPESHDGPTTRANLWLACSRCNNSKADRTHAIDSVSQKRVRLFNPRKDKWDAHFRWADGGQRIEGKTAIGRATVEALNFNLRVRVMARRLWIDAGWHPPLS